MKQTGCNFVLTTGKNAGSVCGEINRYCKNKNHRREQSKEYEKYFSKKTDHVLIKFYQKLAKAKK